MRWKCIGNVLERREKMIDGYDNNFSTTDRPIYVKPTSMNPPNIYIKGKWLDEKKDQYTNVFIDDKPLIRCKDCKFWGTEQDGYCAAIDDPYMLETNADDFCSWGEKNE